MAIVNLESFCIRKGIKVKNRFGIIGLGQYGNKIADLFASLKDDNERPLYDAIAINSFVGDFANLKHISKERKFGLKGIEDGCGRNPELAKEALAQNKDNQKILFESFEHIKDSDIFLVAGGMGGGTATGIISMTIKALNRTINMPLIEEGKRPKAIGAVITLPLASAPANEKRNALIALLELEKIMNDRSINFKFIIIVDNEKAFRDYRSLKAEGTTDFDGWMSYSNNNVVQVMHELNVATNFPSDRTFDPRDLRNIFENNTGCITFGKYKFPITDAESEKQILEHTLKALYEKNVLANGFNFKETRQAGVLIVKPVKRKDAKNVVTNDTLDDIDMGLSKEMPAALGRYSGYVDWANPDEAIIYTIAKIEEFPKRAKEELSQEYNEAKEIIAISLRNSEFKTSIDSIDDSIFNSNLKGIVDDSDPFTDFLKPNKKGKQINDDIFQLD